MEASRLLRTQGTNAHPGTIIVDAPGHIFGRLASIIAKELLNGQHVVDSLAFHQFHFDPFKFLEL